MKKYIKFLLIVVISTNSSFISSIKAAGMGMGMGPPAPCGGPFPPCPVPIDSSVWILIIAGIGLATYSILKMKKKNPA